jgi:hypothetical protein
MSCFFRQELASAKMGSLLSFSAMLLTIIAARLLRVKPVKM